MRRALIARLKRLEEKKINETFPIVFLCLYEDVEPARNLLGFRGGANNQFVIKLQDGETVDQLQERAQRELPQGGIFTGIYQNANGLVTPMGVEEGEWEQQAIRHTAGIFELESRISSMQLRGQESHS